MPEQHNIEYKTNWHEDHLKIICAFANSQGGKLYIGKDDNGNSIGVSGYKRLMDDLPNKIKNHLGITAEVNLEVEPDLSGEIPQYGKSNKHIIEIIVPPYSVAISLRGRYYSRVGSTTTELTGNSLNDFLLRKSGQTWDDVIEERAIINDIDPNTISSFLDAAKKSGRLPDSKGLTKIQLLQKLRLAEDDKLKRAAIILFGKDPGRFYPNISVKIGRFSKDDTDLKFQEVVEGNLFHLLDEVLLQLNRKFLTQKIDFEGLQRIEKGEYPTAALREMLLNALVHKNYSGATIQIKVYDDKFSIWNEGTLPEGLTFESLKQEHPSRPRNPIIADVCFLGGYIDAWGRGTLKVINSCKEAELPEPQMKESSGGFQITIFKDSLTEEQLKKLGLNARQIKALLYIKENGKITNKEYRNLTSLSDEGARIDLGDLVDKNLLISKGSGRNTHYVLNEIGD